MKGNAYSVGQVTAYIKNMFSQDFMLSRVRVKGEVSNCKYHTSGHIYFTLKDGEATLRSVMFAGNRGGLSFKMKDGDRVVASGSIGVYERNGQYQLYAKEIERDGVGDLYLRFEALKRELGEMGMFAQEYKREIPRYARRVGIVTAETGAAIRDICNVASRRNPYVQLILCPAYVQGEGAAESIAEGIRALDAYGVDVMIVGRGGGSIEDLWAFNEEEVARAIFECDTPVISAVGHETDWTIADFVADLRAPTPSAAAELAVFDYGAAVGMIESYRERMRRAALQRLAHDRLRADSLSSRLEKASPERMLRERQARAAALGERLSARLYRLLEQKKNRAALLSSRLEGLSPLVRLRQGYAFVTGGDGRAIRDASQVGVGDEVSIRLLRGSLRAVVTGAEVPADGADIADSAANATAGGADCE